MNNYIKKLFLPLTLALCIISTSLNAAEVVAAGLKGTYNNLPKNIQQLSPLHGAVMAENGDLKRLLTSDKGPLGILAGHMFKEINGIMCITTQASNPVAVLSLEGIIEIIKQINDNKLCTDLLFIGTEQSLENLTPFGSTWFNAYKTWKNGNTQSQRKNNFLSNAPEFLKAIDTAATDDKQTTQFILTAFVYLVSKTPKDLHHYFKNFYPALPDSYFTNYEYQIFNDLFTGTVLTENQAQNNVEQMVFWFLKRKAGSLYFLRVPQQYALIKKKEVPVCAEGAIQTAFNCMLYDTESQELNFSKLNHHVETSLNPDFKTFIEKHKNPHIADYFKTTLDDSVNLLSNVPGIAYLEKNYELSPSTQNILAIFNYLFGTDATNFIELGKMLSSKTRTIEFSKSLKLTQEEENEDDFDHNTNDSSQNDDIDPFELIKQIEHEQTPTKETPLTSTETSTPDTSNDEDNNDDDSSNGEDSDDNHRNDDENNEEDSDEDNDNDEQEISLLPTTEKQFITITITDKDNPKNPIIIEMVIDPEKHSETNFVDKNSRVLSPTTLQNIETVRAELGQNLLTIISIDWYRTIVRAFKRKVFADEESFLTFLQTYQPPVASLTAPSDNDDYLIENIILVGRLDLLKALHRYGLELVNAPTDLGKTTLEVSLATPEAVSAGITDYLIELGAQLNPSSLNIIPVQDSTWAPLKNALYAKNIKAVEKLLQLGANPNIKGQDFTYTDDKGNSVTFLGQYPLEIAIANKNPKLTEILLRYKADPNITDNYGSPLLFKALYNKNPFYTKLLLEHGADPRVRSKRVRSKYVNSDYSKTALELIKDDMPELLQLAQQKAEQWEGKDNDVD